MTITYTATNLGGFTSTFTITPTPKLTPTVTYTPTNAVYAVSTALATAPNLNMTSGVTTLTAGTYYFSCVHLGAGAMMTITGAVTIYTECFTLDAGATINGIGGGYLAGFGGTAGGYEIANGPGAGRFYYLCCVSWYISGGGGHGGAGGTDHDYSCFLAPGGSSNDDPIHPSQMGSSGMSYDDFYPSNPPLRDSAGGALLDVVVYNPATNTVAPAVINGTIDMSGNNGCLECGPESEDGSGGAGGTLLMEASNITGTGLLQANGGNNFVTGAGAGGGGGIISLIENSTSYPGTISVIGGDGNGNTTNGCTFPSSAGNAGSVTFTLPPSSGF
jgi:hypothetical protein